MDAPIYLDHNATTPVFPEVVEAMRACWAKPYLNPVSQHSFGRAARRMLEDARDRIGEMLGAKLDGSMPDRVIFTSGGTEANNLAIGGFLQRPNAANGVAPGHLVVSAIEHPSIATLADHLSQTGVEVSRLGVDEDCMIRTRELPSLLRPNSRGVGAMLVNNETGVIQPVGELAAMCNERGIPLHTDASQAAGKMQLNFRELGVATMAVAAHKFGGPLGIGALIVRGDIDLSPQLFGGFQQAGMRPGTESISLAVGMRLALELWESNRSDWIQHLEIMRSLFKMQLGGVDEFLNPVLHGDELVHLGQCADCLPTTSNIAFVGLDRQQLFLALDQAGVACSTGSACASGSSEPSPTHIAMGCEPRVISSALRFSFGVGTTTDEVEEAARRIINVCNGLRR